MNVQPIRRPLALVGAEVLAFGVFEGDEAPPKGLEGTPLADTLVRLIECKDLPTSPGEVAPLLGIPAGGSGLASASAVVFGLGKREKFAAGPAFTAGVALAKRLAGRPRGVVAVALPEGGETVLIASALVEGLVVGSRGGDLRRSEPSRHPIADLLIVAPEDGAEGFEAAVHRGAILGRSVNLARDLANTPPAEKRPTALANRAREVGEAAGLSVTVWDRETIERERFGGLLGVAAGSDEPPAFVILEHRKGGDSPSIALVGKGVTFDSGGLSLKPSASMEDMKSDMTGAAVVLSDDVGDRSPGRLRRTSSATWRSPRI